MLQIMYLHKCEDIYGLYLSIDGISEIPRRLVLSPEPRMVRVCQV